jgi:hypothetical protein
MTDGLFCPRAKDGSLLRVQVLVNARALAIDFCGIFCTVWAAGRWLVFKEMSGQHSRGKKALHLAMAFEDQTTKKFFVFCPQRPCHPRHH